MQYQYLIAGLEDLQLGKPMKLTNAELQQLLEEQLTPNDLKLLQLLQQTADDPAIVALFETDEVQDHFHETSLTEQDFRTQLLYEQGMRCRNRFLRRWFEFNLNLNNVLAAAVCQKHGYDAEKVIVGQNEVANLLRKGNMLKNQNLAAVLPELKDIIALTEIQDLYERERHQDALRWQWLETNALFNYFDIEAVLAYYLKAQILHRWDDLTKEHGEQIFRLLLADMKRDVKF